MKTVEISLNGKKLPLRATMGAMKDFKKLTGRDPKDMVADSAVDMSVFLYCCISSACRKDKKKFDMTLDDFLDSVDVDTINGWSTELSNARNSGTADGAEEDPHDSEKKAVVKA